MRYEYKIQKNDRFLCLSNYIMDDDTIAYTKDKIYLSEVDNCITDNQFDVNHNMENQIDFFEFFKLVDAVS